MQQFQVPQFIDIEDRIIGPLTLRQFLYLLGAAAVGLLGWAFLYFALFAVFAVPIAAFFVALAFVKINGRSLPTVLSAAINYYFKPRLYLWQTVREPTKPAAPKTAAPPSLLAGVPKLSESKLNDLAWSLDVNERVRERE